MSERFSTAGMFLAYCVESTAGSRPTTGYTKIPEVKSMPSFNPTPEGIESTTLSETEYKTYVKGLKDVGQALEFNANMTDDLDTAWATLISAYTSAISATPAKAVWFCVAHPKLNKATYFTGDPAGIGLNEATVGGMAETTLYITPTGAPVRDSKPTTV